MNKKGPKIDNYRKMRKKGNFHIFQKRAKNEKFAKMIKMFRTQQIFLKKERKKREKKRKKTEHTIISSHL